MALWLEHIVVECMSFYTYMDLMNERSHTIFGISSRGNIYQKAKDVCMSKRYLVSMLMS